MFIVGLLSWWYTTGWRQRVVMAREHLAALVDYFSIDLLLRTLFSPFRQISAGKVQGPLGVQLRAWLDRLVSRGIGAMIRLFMIVIGALAMIVATLIYSVGVVLWAVVPLLPVIGIILGVSGWVPWQIL